MISQKYLFGTALQDYYLDIVRDINIKRNARIDALSTREDALAYIAEVKAKIQAAFPLPEGIGTVPESTITGSREYDKFRLDKVIYYSRPGFPVTANLYMPKVEGKVPAVIVACGHSINGKARDMYSKAGITFAEMGYAAMVIDPVAQGERWQFIDMPETHGLSGRNTHEHNMTGKLMALNGEFFGVWRVNDLLRGLDYLLSLPQVDSSRVAVTGTSGGGTLSTFAQALDSRFTMAAPSCYITSWKRNVENEIPADIEQMPPGLLAAGCEMGDFLLAYAPRPILIMGQSNDFFDPRGTVETYEQIKKIYTLLGHPENLQCLIGTGNHGFSHEHRVAAYKFFNQGFNVTAEAAESDLVIPEADLLCTPTGQVISSMPEAETLNSLAVKRAAELAASRPALSADELKCELRRVLAIPEKVEVPYSRRLRSAALQITPGEYMTFSRFALESEARMLTILKYMGDKEYFAFPPGVTELELYVSHQDAAAETLELYCERKMPLAVMDVRGVGELMPSGCDLEENTRVYTWQYGSDYHYDSLSRMLNKPMLGRRVLDILSAIAWLKSHGVETIHLKAKGLGTIPAAIAALLSHDVADVTLMAAPESYENMIRDRLCWCPSCLMIPGALTFTDLPEIYDAIRQTKTLELVTLPDADWWRTWDPKGLN